MGGGRGKGGRRVEGLEGWLVRGVMKEGKKKKSITDSLVAI